MRCDSSLGSRNLSISRDQGFRSCVVPLFQEPSAPRPVAGNLGGVGCNDLCRPQTPRLRGVGDHSQVQTHRSEEVAKGMTSPCSHFTGAL
ncbi:hypothetical protein MRX96_024736 [Rhipicephalus microplus]